MTFSQHIGDRTTFCQIDLQNHYLMYTNLYIIYDETSGRMNGNDKNSLSLFPIPTHFPLFYLYSHGLSIFNINIYIYMQFAKGLKGLRL